MLLLAPSKAMAADVTARAEYDKTTKQLRLVMDDQTPADEENTLVVYLYDPETNKNKWFDNKYDYCEWPDDFRSAQSVVIDESFKDYKLPNCQGMFNLFKSLKDIAGLEYLNTVNVEDMSYMFRYCEKLETLDLSKFNTDKVTDMSYMFSYCRGLKTLDVSKFNTDKVKNMDNMFVSCTSLETLDVSNFNTANVTNMNHMFTSCTSLKALDVSKFNTDKVKNMSYMFFQCFGIESLDVSKFNTGNVTDMSYMFSYCRGLKTLDLSSFNTAKVQNMSQMFYCCSNMKKIYVSDQFTTESVSSSNEMFYQCYWLPNFYNSSTIDKTNAHYRNGGYLLTYYRTADGDLHDLSGNDLKVDQLALDDSKYFVARAPFTATAATYSRTLNGGTTWATLCLPFEVSLEGKNFRAFRVASVSDDNVELEELTASIAAGTPVIIKMNDGATDISIYESNRPIATAPKAEGAADAQYQLNGLYTLKTFYKDTDSNCYIVKGDMLMNPSKMLENTNTKTVGSKAFRAYLTEQTTTPSPARMLSLGGQTTAIDRIADTLADGSAQYFDLQGRRLDAPQKGMNILKRGGKTVKIMIR